MLISIEKCQSILQKMIIWTKKSGKGQQEWKKAYLDISIRHPRKLKTLVKTICFKGHFIPSNIGIQKYHCLLLWTITIYGTSMQRCVLSSQVWVVAQTIVVTLGLWLANAVLTQVEAIGCCLMHLLQFFQSSKCEYKV
jgi:hypothetical protein